MAGKAAVETKTENKQAVYRYIFSREGATRQDIYADLGISLPTIKQALEHLERSGLITSAEVVRNTGGRNAVSYRIRYDARYSVGLFLSANHITAVCTDLSGTIILKKRKRMKLDAHSDAYLRGIGELTGELITEAVSDPEKVLGVGIAVPSLVSEDGEKILFGMTHDFSGVTRAVLSRYIPYPTRLFHDSYVAGFAEVWRNPAIRNAFYLSLNNSVGGAMIFDNRIYEGNHQRAGEIGHLILPGNQKKCYCGNIGCFDTVCNAGVLDSYTDGNLEEYFRKLKDGDEGAVQLWEEYRKNLALMLHNLRMLYDCEIILGGYVGAYIEPFMDELNREIDTFRIFPSYAAEYVIPCSYKNESTAAGAAIQLIERYIRSL